MGKAIGQLRSISLAGRKTRFTSDIAVDFWPGGLHAIEFMSDNQGGAPEIRSNSGYLKGVSLSGKDEVDLEFYLALIKESARTPVSCMFEFANGAKYSGLTTLIFAAGTGPFTSADGKITVDFMCSSTTGEWAKIK